MPNLSLKLPNLDDTDFNSREAIRQLRDYMFRLQEELTFVLAHLDEDNLSQELKQTIADSGDSAGVNATVQDELENMKTSITQNAQAITQRAKKGEIISEINQSAEQVKVAAGKIALEGVVTANNGFKINLDGSMEATAGSLGAFSADEEGNLAGAASLQVGGITLSGRTASGMQITADNLDYEYGQPSGSDDAYFLGISDTGKLCLFDLYIQNGQLQISTPGGVPQSDEALAILITTAGNGLKKRATASTTANILGTCATGELYRWTQTGFDAQGYDWYKCDAKYTYNSSTGRYVAASVTPFWVRQYSDGNAQKYYDLTTVNV